MLTGYESERGIPPWRFTTISRKPWEGLLIDGEMATLNTDLPMPCRERSVNDYRTRFLPLREPVTIDWACSRGRIER